MITRERTRMSKVMQSFRSQQWRLFLLNRSRNSPKWNYSYSKDVKVSGRIEGFIDYEILTLLEQVAVIGYISTFIHLILNRSFTLKFANSSNSPNSK